MLQEQNNKQIITLGCEIPSQTTIPTITSVNQHHGFICLEGSTEYCFRLPNDDLLLIRTSFKSLKVSLLLTTHDAKKLDGLPNTKTPSLSTQAICALQCYIRRVQLYYNKTQNHELAPYQTRKYQIACELIQALKAQQAKERDLDPNDYIQQEEFRIKLLTLLSQTRFEHRKLCANLGINSGKLGDILHTINSNIESFEFAPFKISKKDQLIFSEEEKTICLE